MDQAVAGLEIVVELLRVSELLCLLNRVAGVVHLRDLDALGLSKRVKRHVGVRRIYYRLHELGLFEFDECLGVIFRLLLDELLLLLELLLELLLKSSLLGEEMLVLEMRLGVRMRLLVIDGSDLILVLKRVCISGFHLHVISRGEELLFG